MEARVLALGFAAGLVGAASGAAHQFVGERVEASAGGSDGALAQSTVDGVPGILETLEVPAYSMGSSARSGLSAGRWATVIECRTTSRRLVAHEADLVFSLLVSLASRLV